jgi:quercetin dioxygenase-like cupin family protein
MTINARPNDPPNWNGLRHARYFIAESRLSTRMEWLRVVASALFYTVVAFAVAGVPTGSAQEPETVKEAFQHAISNIPGKSLIALVVDYPPGAASAPHIHTKTGFIYAYVVSGEIESKVNDGATQVYKEGESWFEPPGASHSISRNVSTTKPAKLLAVFVVDTGDRDLTMPVR